jgi:hypothetical protein
MAYKGRPSAKTIAREFPFVVEILVPEGASMTCMRFAASAGSQITTYRAAVT